MNIAELFVNLGVKGSEKTVDALTNTKKGLGEVKSMSLEAKAAIVGLVYGLEHMMAASATLGNGMVNFNALTKGSMQELQKWQYAARQVGVGGEDVVNAAKNVQKQLTNVLTGQPASKGLARLALVTGGMTKEDVLNAQKNPFLMLQRAQQYALKEQNAGLRNETLASLGFSEGMIAAMARNAFRPQIMNKAPAYSDKELGQLDKVNAAWSNLGNKISMAFGHFTSKHGQQIVGDLSAIATQVIHLVEALQQLAEQLQVFSLLGKSTEGLTKIFGGIASAVGTVKKLGSSNPTEHQKGIEDVKGFFNEIGDVYKGMKISEEENMEKSRQELAAKLVPQPKNAVIEKTNVNVHQTNTYHGDHGKDVHKINKAHHDSVKRAWNQAGSKKGGY